MKKNYFYQSGLIIGFCLFLFTGIVMAESGKPLDVSLGSILTNAQPGPSIGVEFDIEQSSDQGTGLGKGLAPKAATKNVFPYLSYSLTFRVVVFTQVKPSIILRIWAAIISYQLPPIIVI